MTSHKWRKIQNFAGHHFLLFILEIPACMLHQNNSNQSDFHGRPNRGLHKNIVLLLCRFTFWFCCWRLEVPKTKQWHTHRYNNFIVEYRWHLYSHIYGTVIDLEGAASTRQVFKQRHPYFFRGKDNLQGISPKTVSVVFSWCRMPPKHPHCLLRRCFLGSNILQR